MTSFGAECRHGLVVAIHRGHVCADCGRPVQVALQPSWSRALSAAATITFVCACAAAALAIAFSAAAAWRVAHLR